jgi:hypothetical protein
VPLPIPGDRRAWDGIAVVNGLWIGIEVETRLYDLQAILRRTAIKRRDDDRIGRVALLLQDTRHNRRVLDTSRAVVREAFPLETRAVLNDLGAGRAPAADGIVLLRPQPASQTVAA